MTLIACDTTENSNNSDQQVSDTTITPEVEAVRGVWLTNVASEVLDSKENIKEAVALCDKLGFNTIFVVTWNRAHTIYPSRVLERVTGKKISDRFQGRDPLAEVIEAAKKYDIKVFAWFEFGFASSYDDPTGGPLIKAKPHWASLDKNGMITSKNKFQWMNAFHPEVQDFITDLIVETVENYDIDGIQGDDRLPALPSNGGYSEYTVELYKSEHNGNKPPSNEKDYEWVKWRSNKLNIFLKNLVDELKIKDPELIISMAPSIYPWSEENYLQDWPTWLNMGVVDLIIPQVYRYDFKSYKKEMDNILEKQLGQFDNKGFYPGVLLQVNEFNPDQQFLDSMINYNRKKNVNGEVFFFYEGIKKYKEYFKSKYGEPVDFPEYNKIK
ncbi:hypothetical protein DCC35_19480 [Mangrovivirga cuniculi]|uniref:Glycosyl hydrolase-like 10 domain-containing protein n=2 Tax=Mangrovivirga cuniculi TaxID=2715131 RepID=A0A4D7K2I9_9BACT|nr:hypothetical protein DCC35_19480 [Mangrovivirga cuniculi]